MTIAWAKIILLEVVWRNNNTLVVKRTSVFVNGSEMHALIYSVYVRYASEYITTEYLWSMQIKFSVLVQLARMYFFQNMTYLSTTSTGNLKLSIQLLGLRIWFVKPFWLTTLGLSCSLLSILNVTIRTLLVWGRYSRTIAKFGFYITTGIKGLYCPLVVDQYDFSWFNIGIWNYRCTFILKIG